MRRRLIRATLLVALAVVALADDDNPYLLGNLFFQNVFIRIFS
jgi:hypothetical protein